MDECLNHVNFDDLQALEQEMENSVKLIRDRKVGLLIVFVLVSWAVNHQ